MKCPKCSEENVDGTRYCRRCGAAMGSAGTRFGKLITIVLLALLVAGFVGLVSRRGSKANQTMTNPPSPVVTPGATGGPLVVETPNGLPDKTRLGIAYGTEKREWLTWASVEFAKTPEGANVQIELIPMGSLEAAQAIVRNDKNITVWSPASALYKDVFVRDYKASHDNKDPIAREEPLALTPMVLVMWDERYSAFLHKYPEVSFRTIGQALSEKGGWDAIAGKPDWMFFKFSHTDPNKSNSGLMAIVLMGYDFHGKNKGLNGGDITSPGFQKWMGEVESSLTGAASGLVNSTGTLMTSMIQRGWSTYDVVLVYENVAIESLARADGRWGPLKVVYPKYNMWNDNPYYILDVPWSTPQQREAAQAFLTFLLSDAVQTQAMRHGFRPANVNISTKSADSPFVKNTALGIQTDVPGIFCEPPRAEVIENLLLLWQRSQGSH